MPETALLGRMGRDWNLGHTAGMDLVNVQLALTPQQGSNQ